MEFVLKLNIRTMRKSAAEFFGVVKDESKENEERKLWNERRMRMLRRKCGKLKVIIIQINIFNKVILYSLNSAINRRSRF